MTPKYTHLFSTADTYVCLKQIGSFFSDISGWMTNSRLRLNADKTYLIIFFTCRQHNKRGLFFPTPIITLSYNVHSLGVTFHGDFNFRKHISLTCRCCFYYIRDVQRIDCNISLSVANIMAALLIISRIQYIFIITSHLRILQISVHSELLN